MMIMGGVAAELAILPRQSHTVTALAKEIIWAE